MLQPDPVRFWSKRIENPNVAPVRNAESTYSEFPMERTGAGDELANVRTAPHSAQSSSFDKLTAWG